MSVTYLDLPANIDLIRFLFGEDKLTVPQSRFTPELIVRFYERALQLVDVQTLHSKSDDNPHGLVSLPSLLRHEPRLQSGANWLKLTADKEVIESALPKKTPYQLQYLPLFGGFRLPRWEDVPLVPTENSLSLKVVGDLHGAIPLYGKNKQLYLVTALWKPSQSYYGGGKEPRYLEDGPLVFHLGHLAVEPIEWSDERVIAKIRNGRWSDVHAFRAGLQLALNGTADILEMRARGLRHAAEHFDQMSIYYGR